MCEVGARGGGGQLKEKKKRKEKKREEKRKKEWKLRRKSKRRLKCLCGLDNEERERETYARQQWHKEKKEEKAITNDGRRLAPRTTQGSIFLLIDRSQSALISPPFLDSLAVKNNNFIGRTSVFLLSICLFATGMVVNNRQLIRNYIALWRAHFLFSLRKKRDFQWCMYVCRCALYVHRGQKHGRCDMYTYTQGGNERLVVNQNYPD